MNRCDWVGVSPLERRYHDQEWGVPIYDDRKLFEALTLEGAQAGLSWVTILRKREGYRIAFDNFEAKKIVQYSPEKMEELMANTEIVRNKLKIHSVVTNAKCFIKVQKEFGHFSDYIWSFVEGKPTINKWKSAVEIPSSTSESEKMSKDLKKRGFKFVGPTICYAFMQATGMVNDHIESCFRCGNTHR